MKIQRANSLKTSHDLLVQWQNQQNKRKWSNVDGLFIESFLCFLVSLDRVTDIKTKTFFCNTSNSFLLSLYTNFIFLLSVLFWSWLRKFWEPWRHQRACTVNGTTCDRKRKDLWPRKEWFLFEAFHIGQSQYAPIIKWTHLLQNSEKNKRGRRRGREKRVLPCYEWFNFWLVEKLAGIFLVNHQA